MPCSLCVQGVFRSVLHGESRVSPATPRNQNNNQPSRGQPQDLTEATQTPTRYTLARDTIILHIATPQAASSERTHATLCVRADSPSDLLAVSHDSRLRLRSKCAVLLRLPARSSVHSWLLCLRSASLSAPALLPAPMPVLHMSAPVRRGAVARLGLA